MSKMARIFLFSAVLSQILDVLITICAKKRYPDIIETNSIFRDSIAEQRFAEFAAIKFGIFSLGSGMLWIIGKMVGPKMITFSMFSLNICWLLPIMNFNTVRRVDQMHYQISSIFSGKSE